MRTKYEYLTLIFKRYPVERENRKQGESEYVWPIKLEAQGSDGNINDLYCSKGLIGKKLIDLVTHDINSILNIAGRLGWQLIDCETQNNAFPSDGSLGPHSDWLKRTFILSRIWEEI